MAPNSAKSVVTSSTTDELYAAQFKQMDKEAWATLGAAVLITVVFWGVIALTHDLDLTFLTMPLWFVLSCIGGYLFSIVVVLFLVKKLMKNLELHVPSLKELSKAQPQQTAQSKIQAQAQSQQHKGE